MVRGRYLELHERGELETRAAAAVGRLEACDLCPRQCAVDRTADERGFCRVGRAAQVASSNLHFGEETPLVGSGGSGTIFFAGCNLNCHFCQNYDISHVVDGGLEVTPVTLAKVMLELQRRGAENINFVTPSHVIAQILEALCIAAESGLRLPLVYNTGGYDSVNALELLEGVVDIYMPDAKTWSEEYAERFCQADDYPDQARRAIAEMHRQVGDLALDAKGVATSGLLVRHLVMPEGTAGTAEWMRFLAELSERTYVNVMAQYRPCGRVPHARDEFPELLRGVTAAEMDEAFRAADDAGITRLDERPHRGMHLPARLIFEAEE